MFRPVPLVAQSKVPIACEGAENDLDGKIDLEGGQNPLIDGKNDWEGGENPLAIEKIDVEGGQNPLIDGKNDRQGDQIPLTDG